MQRDHLFTNIHKAIRAGLFDLIVTAGATDWNDQRAVAGFGDTWCRLQALLEAHTHHEDDHILRILDPHDPAATGPATDQHRDLDGWLTDLAAWIDLIVADPDPVEGLALYSALALFCSSCLAHIHDEETTVMARIWELCTDDEIAATCAAFMADMDPTVLDTSLRFTLPTIDPDARTGLITGLAATAPVTVFNGVLAIATDILPAIEAGRLVGIARTEGAA